MSRRLQSVQLQGYPGPSTRWMSNSKMRWITPSALSGGWPLCKLFMMPVCVQLALDYIAEKHLNLAPLYEAIYNKKDCSNWSMLDQQMQQFCQAEGLLYVREILSSIPSMSRLLWLTTSSMKKLFLPQRKGKDKQKRLEFNKKLYRRFFSGTALLSSKNRIIEKT